MLGTIWYNDQFKLALRVEEGRKYDWFIVLTHTGIRKVKILKRDAGIRPITEDRAEIHKAAVRYLESDADITLGAERSLLKVIRETEDE